MPSTRNGSAAHNEQLTVGSLFSGIGGFDLGLERAGMLVRWQCEADAFCRQVLAKHWPGVPCFDDIITLANPPAVDVLAGGFPCQDLSVAGKGAGLSGSRSGLWSEFARLIGEVGPRYVIVENVPTLKSRGLERVLGEMAALGYDAEWDCIPATAVGAPHRRDRIWIVAYPQREQLREQPRRRGGACWSYPALTSVDGEARALADPQQPRLEGQRPESGQSQVAQSGNGGALADADEQQPGFCGRFGESGEAESGWHIHQWLVEPDVGRVANGVPARVDRLRSLGNALVPQIAEWIGHRIVEYEAA